jgi:hypothetical protein
MLRQEQLRAGMTDPPVEEDSSRCKDLDKLNSFFIRSKYEVPPFVAFSEVPTVRSEVFEVFGGFEGFEFATQLRGRTR